MQCIYRNRGGYSVIVSIHGQRYQWYFSANLSSLDAALEAARDWRDYMLRLTIREANDEMNRLRAAKNKSYKIHKEPATEKFTVKRIPAERLEPVDRGLRNITRNRADGTWIIECRAPGNRRIISVVYDDDYPSVDEAKWAAVVIRNTLDKHYEKVSQSPLLYGGTKL